MTDLHAGEALKKITLAGHYIALYCALTMAFLRARGKVARSRAREAGASTVEWAIIAAVSVVMATLIGGVIYKVVSNKSTAIDKCNNTAPGVSATC